MPEAELRALIAEHGFTIGGLSYRLISEGRFFEYRMVIRTLRADNARRLAETLGLLPAVVAFRIAPTGD
jgi:putative Mg2+ transporter-C (MgtC) family protein